MNGFVLMEQRFLWKMNDSQRAEDELGQKIVGEETKETQKCFSINDRTHF